MTRGAYAQRGGAGEPRRLLWTGAATVSLRRTVELAYATGATEDEILVLLAIASAIGHARVVDAAPRLALALGYDLGETER